MKSIIPSSLGLNMQLIMSSLGIAQVKVVDRRGGLGQLGHKGSENWVTGISQLIVSVFSIPFEVLMQSLIMKSPHYNRRVEWLRQSMTLKPKYLLPATLQGMDPWKAGLSHPAGTGSSAAL